MGLPKHYAYFDDDSFILGPTPSGDYVAELHYGYYPESIVTANTTWLGTDFDSALLNGALIEAIRFLKGEPDVVQNYEKKVHSTHTDTTLALRSQKSRQKNRNLHHICKILLAENVVLELPASRMVEYKSGSSNRIVSKF